jgi:alpha-tubulin suppressor-like RCC1 family protein
MAITPAGQFFVWGIYDTDSLSFRPKAFNVGGLNGKVVVKAAGGVFHHLALDSAGVVYSWGTNNSGVLGDGTTNDRDLPAAVTSGALAGKTISIIAAGSRHSLALGSDGTVYAWGSKTSGQLGNGTTTSSSVPIALNASSFNNKTIVDVAAGLAHSLALASDGTVFCWGNFNGTLSGWPAQQTTPKVMNIGALQGKTAKAIASSDESTFALVLATDGTVAAWGHNKFGQFGNGTTNDTAVPVPAATTGAVVGKQIVSLSTGIGHSLFLSSDGKLFTAGLNEDGQLGNGTSTDSSSTVAVNQTGVLQGKTILQIAAGGDHNLVLAQ